MLSLLLLLSLLSLLVVLLLLLPSQAQATDTHNYFARAQTHIHPPVKRARSKRWRDQTRRLGWPNPGRQNELRPKVFAVGPKQPKEEGDRLRGHLESRKPWMLRCVLCFPPWELWMK